MEELEDYSLIVASDHTIIIGICVIPLSRIEDILSQFLPSSCLLLAVEADV